MQTSQEKAEMHVDDMHETKQDIRINEQQKSCDIPASTSQT